MEASKPRRASRGGVAMSRAFSMASWILEKVDEASWTRVGTIGGNMDHARSQAGILMLSTRIPINFLNCVSWRMMNCIGEHAVNSWATALDAEVMERS